MLIKTNLLSNKATFIHAFYYDGIYYMYIYYVCTEDRSKTPMIEINFLDWIKKITSPEKSRNTHTHTVLFVPHGSPDIKEN